MFGRFESIVFHSIFCLSLFSINSSLSITQMEVPSMVRAPEGAILTCEHEEGNENDTFNDIRWFKLVNNHWKLIKIFPQAPMRAGIPPDMKAEGDGEDAEAKPETDEIPKDETSEEPPKDDPPKEDPPKEDPTSEPTKEDPTTEPPKEDPPKEDPTTEAPKDVTEAAKENPEPTDPKPDEKTDATTIKPEKKKESKFYELEGMKKSDDSNIEFTQTSLSSAGYYKCVVNSSKEIKEMIKEMRIFYKPAENSKPELSVPKISDNHISVKCTAPASYPMMALNFFINYESAPHEEVHRLPAKKTNISDEMKDQLLMNVEEFRFRATKHSVLNGNISVVCTATLADIHSSFAQILIPFEGTLYNPKCLSTLLIVLIVLAVIIFVLIIGAVVWLFLRKKKLNSLNKVAELFNKQKTITVLVDNNTNELKIE